MSADSGQFGHARANEAQLNARQREILDLLVAGKTNGEIGERLGITLDGAKWNVSEILTKLGLDSREDAAEYWRWRSRPASRVAALRGLLGLGTLKWVGGAAAVIVGVAVVGALLGRGEETTQGAPFYLEARVEVLDNSRSIGTNPAGSVPPTSERRVSTVRWWSKDRDHARWEFEQLEGEVSGAQTTVIVADGTHQWVYRSDTNSYTQTPLPPLPEGWLTRPIAVSLLLGPGFARSKDELIETLRGWAGAGGEVREAGTETVLGRKTTIIEMTPASRSSSGNSDGTTIDTSEGVARIWLDEERMLILRYVTEGDSQEIDAEVTVLRYGSPPPPEKLRFEPPKDSVLDDGRSGIDGGSDYASQGSVGPNGGAVTYTTPRGFLVFSSLPEAFVVNSYTIESNSNNEPFRFVLGLKRGSDTLSLSQTNRPGGLPPVYDRGKTVTVAGVEARVQVAAPGDRPPERVTAAFWRDGLMVVADGIGFTEAEVIAILESLQPAP